MTAICDVTAQEAVPFHTLHYPHTLETRGYIADSPFRPHTFYLKSIPPRIPGDVSRMSLVDHRPHHAEGALGVLVVFSVAYPPDDIVRASFCKQPVTGIDDAVENAYIRAVQRHYITIIIMLAFRQYSVDAIPISLSTCVPVPKRSKHSEPKHSRNP